LIFLLLVVTPVNSAVIKGKVYSWELNRVVAIVEINTTPMQRIVTENGSYEFEVPPGVYEIKAYSFTDEFELYCNETVEIPEDRTYTLDLILFPKLDDEEFYDFDLSFDIDGESNGNIGFVMALAILVLLTVYVLFRRFKKEKEMTEEDLPEDLKKIIDLLESRDGRATQKELREKLRWSESKLSLALVDLERRGLIEKVKKGRGNVIFLKRSN